MNNKILLFLLLNLLFVLPTFRAFMKFSDIKILIVYIILFNSCIFLITKYTKVISKLNNKLWLVIILATSVAAYFVYPKVDSRKFSGNFGSTADDAFILGVESFRNSGKIYDVSISDIAPTSPGPGWIIMNSPFVFSKAYSLFLVFYFAISLFFLYKIEGGFVANLFYILCCSSVLFWELLFNGHDIIPISFALFIIIYLFPLLINKNTFYLVLLAVFTGVFATSRIVFIVTPIVVFAIGYRLNKLKSILFLIISLLVCLGLHLYYYNINSYYQPFHLFFKAYRILGIELMVVLSIIILIVIKFFNKYYSNKYLVFFVFSLILIPISIMDLIRLNFNFIEWEGANYLYPLIPLFSYIFIEKMMAIKRNNKDNYI